MPSLHSPFRQKWTCRDLEDINLPESRDVVDLVCKIDNHEDSTGFSSDGEFAGMTTDVALQLPVSENEKTMFAQNNGTVECLLVDTGATTSVISRKEFLTNFRPATRSCKGVADVKVPSSGTGDFSFNV